MTTRSHAPSLPLTRFTLSPMAGAYTSLGIALITLSFAAVTMRLAQIHGLPSNLIAAARLSLAGLILTPFVLMRYQAELKRLTRRDVLWSTFAGVWIGIHFLLITVSLEHTSILVSQVIINTGPLWVALLETAFLKAKLTQAHYIAIAVTMLGGSLIGLASALTTATPGGDAFLHMGGIDAVLSGDAARDPVFGAVLALLGAISGSIYLTIGRKARANIATVPYVWMVFSVGGLVAFGAVFLTQTPIFGHPSTGYFWLVVLAVVPHLIGHSSFNHSLRFFSATLVSIYGQSITVSAAVIAFLLFAEVPTVLEAIGSGIIMFGVMLAILTPTKASREARRNRRLAAE